MKTTIGNKRYNSEKCEKLGEINHYSHSNNYSGGTSLLRATDGVLLLLTEGNGQDFHVQDSFGGFEDSQLSIGDFDMTDEQEARCAELKLIEIVE